MLKEDSFDRKLFSYFEDIQYQYYLKKINEDIDPYSLYLYPMDGEKDFDSVGVKLIEAITNLQLKTVYDEEMSNEEFESIYQKIVDDIDYQMKYYLDWQDYIENFSFPRIDYYYLLLHISLFYKILRRARHYLDLWYQKKKLIFRKCYSIHNVSFSNFIASNSSCFLDFGSCYKDFLITDFVCFYKNELLSFDMNSLFDIYKKNLFLSEEEILLFKTFICIPKKLEFSKNVYDNTVSIYYLLEYIEKTHSFLEEYEKYQETDKNEFKE